MIKCDWFNKLPINLCLVQFIILIRRRINWTLELSMSIFSAPLWIILFSFAFPILLNSSSYFHPWWFLQNMTIIKIQYSGVCYRADIYLWDNTLHIILPVLLHLHLHSRVLHIKRPNDLEKYFKMLEYFHIKAK